MVVRRAMALGTMKASPNPLRALIRLKDMTLRINPAMSWKSTHIKPAATTAFLCP